MENIKQRCSTTGKVIYSKRDANAYINNLSKGHRTTHHISRGSNVPKRAYLCNSCGGYHLTHYVNNNHGKPKPQRLKVIYGKGYDDDYEDFVKML